MYSIIVITATFIVCTLFKCLRKNGLEIVKCEKYNKENKKVIYDVKSSIIDTKEHQADYIICTYYFKNKKYKVYVEDYYDLNDLYEEKCSCKIKEARLTSNENNIDEDVTETIRLYAGPNNNFHNMNINYKRIFSQIEGHDLEGHDWSLIIKYENNGVTCVFID